MGGVVVLLGWWLALNLLATARVRAVAARLDGKAGWLLAVIWIAPFGGAVIAWLHTLGLARDAASQPGQDRALPASPSVPAPARLSAPGRDDFMVDEHLLWHQGVPVMDWRALDDWAHGPADAADVATVRHQGRRAWLQHLRQACFPQAQLLESDGALILSTLEPHVAQATARFIGRTRRQVPNVLQGIARLNSDEHSILLVMDSEEDYYQYIAIHYPSEGEFAASGGMFINAGCPHFVVVKAELATIEPVIAHELTHSALAHIDLPRWLDEGLAVNTEIRLTGARRLVYTPHQLQAMHRRFWNPVLIQQFWSGEAFFRPDEGNLLAYELARILVDKLAADWPSFARFVQSARAEDAGNQAAQQWLACQLGHVVAALLEQDSATGWAPDVQAQAAGLATARL